MKTQQITLEITNQNCTTAGRVRIVDETNDVDTDAHRVTGTREELLADAHSTIQKPVHGGNDMFRYKVAANIINALV